MGVSEISKELIDKRGGEDEKVVLKKLKSKNRSFELDAQIDWEINNLNIKY